MIDAMADTVPELVCASSRRPAAWRSTAVLLAVLTTLVTTDAQAIVLNDGAAAAAGGIENYWDAANTQPNVAALLIESHYLCTGTLINPRTIVTATHCVVHEGGGAPVSPGALDTRILFGADAFGTTTPNDRRASGIAIMPGYDLDAFYRKDFAVVSLDKPVTGLSPARLAARGSTAPAIGSLMTMVGYGVNGIGSTPRPLLDALDGRRRIGQTLLTAIEDPSDDGGGHPLYLGLFRDPKHPDDPEYYYGWTLTQPVPALQAGTAQGDSGGPLFLVTEQGLVLIGVLSGGWSNPDNPGSYGDVSMWTPLFMVEDWLRATNPLRQVSAHAGPHVWSDASAWIDPDGPSEVPHNRDGVAGTAGRYWDVTLSQPGRMTLDMNATVDNVAVTGSGSRLDIATPYTLDVITGFAQTAGVSFVSGTLRAPIVALTGGVFGGSGTVVSSAGMLNDGGTVAPGLDGAPGVLSVRGDYRQTSAGTLAVRSFGGVSDRLLVSGAATIDGRLAIFAGADLVPGAAGTVLRAEGGVTGRFAEVTADRSFAFLAPQTGYTADAVTVTFARNGVSFATAARTANQAQAAAAVDSLALAHRVAGQVALSDLAAAPAAFDALSGEIHASARALLTRGAGLLRDAVAPRLRQGAIMRDGGGTEVRPLFSMRDPADPLRFEAWTQGAGQWSRQGSSRDAAALTAEASGVFLGVDATWKERIRLGVVAGYTYRSFSVDARSSSGSSTDYHLGLYGSARLDAFELRGGLGQSWSDIDTHRGVAVGALRQGLSATSEARTRQAFLEVARPVPVPSSSVVVEPFGGLAHVSVGASDFTERGGEAALAVSGGDMTTTFSSLGLRAALPLVISDTSALTLRGGLGWQHAFGDRIPAITAGFATGSAPFSVQGTPLARDSLGLDAGLDLRVQDSLVVGLHYGGEMGGDSWSHAVKARLAFAF